MQHLSGAFGSSDEELGARCQQYIDSAQLCFSITSDSGETVKEWGQIVDMVMNWMKANKVDLRDRLLPALEGHTL